MSPTLQEGETRWVERGPLKPQRGDIIIFHNQEDGLNHVKRVIALEQEEIRMEGNRVFVNDRPLDEPYLPKKAVMADFGPVTVPQGHVFVLGDHRDKSLDSRQWGAISVLSIRGRMMTE